MKPADQLADFVGAALADGRSRAEIAAALDAAGWSPSEVSAALGAWAETGFTPPVPRPRPYVSAREAFSYALTFVSLGMTAWHVVALGFQLVDAWVPDPFDPRESVSAEAIRWSVSFLVVFLPLFLVLQRRLSLAVQADPAKRRSWVRVWIGYITLFIASVTLAGDLIGTIYALLDGELTLRFALKAGLLGAVAGVVFLYFRREMEAGDGAV